MDNLSLFLSLSQTQVRLDVHCLLANAFDISHGALPPGQAPFHLLLQGQCQLQVHGGPALHLRAGDFVLLTQGQAHTVCDAACPHTGAATRTGIAPLHSEPGALPLKTNLPCAHPDKAAVADADLLCGSFLHAGHNSAVLMRLLPPVLHVNLHDACESSALDAISGLLRSEAGQSRPGANAIVNSLGQSLLLLALRLYTRRTPEAASLLALACDARIGPSIQAVLREPEQPWTIERMGRLASMSRATYERHFKARTNMTVGEFLQCVRVMHAATLLRHTSRGLADIARQVGYQSEAAFGKAFRKLMGETPGRWRQRYTLASGQHIAPAPPQCGCGNSFLVNS